MPLEREAWLQRGGAVGPAAELRLAGLVLLSVVCLLCLVLPVTGAFRVLLVVKETCKSGHTAGHFFAA